MDLACHSQAKPTELHNAKSADKLVSSEKMRHPHRLTSSSQLAPFLPLHTVERAMGAPPGTISPNVLLITFMT